MCLGSQKYKDGVDPSQAHLTTARVAALSLAVFVLLEWYKRNSAKRSPMGVQKCPGIEKIFLAGSVVLLSCCASTAANPSCKMSIAMKDRFGDLTTVARIGGSLVVFCEGGLPGYKNRRHVVLRTTGGFLEVPAIIKGGESTIKIIRSPPEYWKILKNIFLGKNIACKCGPYDEQHSNERAVPHPILCSADSQLFCGDRKICSLDGEGNEVCTDRESSRCAFADIKTFLCPREEDTPQEECWNVRRPDTAWPQFEVPEDNKKMCRGQVLHFYF